MPAYKDKNGKWIVKYSYKGLDGKFKGVTKRGFETKRDALNWETDAKKKVHGMLDISLESFASQYLKFISNRIKFSTYVTKEAIIKAHIIPYLGRFKVNEITAREIVAWQDEMLKCINKKTNKKFSKAYLRLLQNTLSSIFAYATRYYNLPINPVHVSGSIGGGKDREMMFWTQEQYKKFSEVMMDKPIFYYAFNCLYYLGIREGELLALEESDIDFEKKELSITKTYLRINGKDYINTPKTKKSIRKVSIPDFLCEELKEYLNLEYTKNENNNRIFLIGKTALTKALIKGADKAGLPRIRVHDLRHSHVSLLIELGYSAVAIADRVGHESIDITYRYAHLFPNKQKSIANDLNKIAEDK